MSKDASVRHAVEAAFYRAAKAHLLRLPHPEVREVGRRLGALGYRAVGGARKIVLSQLETALPELSAEECRETARLCFAHFGSYFCEVVSASRFDDEEILDLFDIEGWEHLDPLIREEKGFFFTCGHFGCWELSAYPLQLLLGNLHMVARPLNNPHVDRDLRAIRERFGAVVIDKAGAGHRMLNSLRKGKRVAMVIDQHVRESAGVQVPFFGRPAWTSPVLAYLANLSGAPIVHFSVLPVAGGRYRMTVRPPIEPLGRGDDHDLALTARLLEEVERDVRQHPALWLWMHRRWRD